MFVAAVAPDVAAAFRPQLNAKEHRAWRWFDFPELLQLVASRSGGARASAAGVGSVGGGAGGAQGEGEAEEEEEEYVEEVIQGVRAQAAGSWLGRRGGGVVGPLLQSAGSAAAAAVDAMAGAGVQTVGAAGGDDTGVPFDMSAMELHPVVLRLLGPGLRSQLARLTQRPEAQSQ